MTDPQQVLTGRFQEAISAAWGPEHAQADPLIRPAQNPTFGDYQANVAMSLGKRLGRNPRQVAAAVVEKLQWLDLLAEAPSVAGPGFINLKLSANWLSQIATSLAGDDRLGVERIATPQTVVIDYSHPNIAKEMHVGHLRSTIIGDALARTLEFQGHRVIRQNHLGDWGTQFGMLIEHLEDLGAAGTATEIRDLNAFYQQAKKRFDSEPQFADRARKRVVALQSGDPGTLAQWKRLVSESMHHFNAAYARLNVTLSDGDVRGESYYNPMLQEVVQILRDKGLAQLSEGAWCVFVPGHEDPLMVQKSDGGFGYPATDLAAIRFRVQSLGAERVIYVVDARQSSHLAKVFYTARAARWLDDHHVAEHVKFGTILGEDGKPFKTRTGDTVRLAELLDEAEQRALAIVREKSPDLAADEASEIAGIVGIGAVKYGDLSADRIKDYVFSWDRMLAMDGNTAPYLQYAYARIRSIFRKSGATPEPGVRITVEHDAERALVLKLSQFPAVVRGVVDRLEPHHLCTWLYDLAATFSGFYESCPVLKAQDDAQRRSRLALCDLTARSLAAGLDLLGIRVIERM